MFCVPTKNIFLLAAAVAVKGLAEVKPWPEKMMFVRHAESYSNSRGMIGEISYADIQDSPLSKKGRSQCAKLNSDLSAYSPPDLIVVSPMQRTIETALLGLKSWIQAGVPVLLKPELRETHLVSPQIMALKQNWGSPTTRWNSSHWDQDAFSFLSKLPNYGFETAQEKEAWDESEKSFRSSVNAIGDPRQKTIQFWKWVANRPEKHIACVSHQTIILKGFSRDPEHHKKPFTLDNAEYIFRPAVTEHGIEMISNKTSTTSNIFKLLST